MQAFHMGAGAQQALGLLGQTMTFPIAKLAFPLLAVFLGTGRLDHGIDVAFEDGRLEDVQDPTQVGQYRHLGGPVLNVLGDGETAGLHRAFDLLAGCGKRVSNRSTTRL